VARWLSVLIVSASLLVALVACGVPAAGPTPTPGGGDPTPTPTAGVNAPAWLLELIAQFEQAEVANPPVSVSEYRYNGQTVFFVPQRCCDIYSDLYDADGDLIAHPDGGITGTGDGRAPDFLETAALVRVVWSDPRGTEARELVDAPIVEAAVNQVDSGYFLRVVSALPDGCHVFAGWEVDDTRLAADKTLTVTVRNTYPVTDGIACTDIYRTLEYTIALPYAFAAGETYTIHVNEVTISFIAGEDKADRQANLDAARARWAAAGYDHYSALFRWLCFCVPDYVAPVRLTVQDGAIVEVSYAEGAGVQGTSDPERYMTVDELFDLLQEAIDANAYRIDVEYHPTLGYPTDAFIDYDAMMADEERGFTLEVHSAGQ
jgi:hypothetical protein